MAVWDDEATEKLKELYVKQGLSAGQCASRMPGFSRNAIIGKVHRLGLGRRQTLVRMCNPRKAKAHPKPQGQRPFVKQSPARALFAMEPVAPPVEELVIPLKERKSIATLGERDCKWPIGDPQHEDFHFCGKRQVAGLPYCEVHARRAYQPPDQRRRPQAPQSVTGGPGQSQAPVATPETASAPARKLEVVKA